MMHFAFARITIVAVCFFGTMLCHAQSETPIKQDDSVQPLDTLDNPWGAEAPLTIVEEMPLFRNNQNAIYEYIASHVVYPEEAREAGAEGTVIATFVVRKDGSVGDVKILRSVHPALNAEVFRMLNAMPPDWKPAKQKGKSVNFQYNVPVKFKLAGESYIPTEAKKKKRKKD